MSHVPWISDYECALYAKPLSVLGVVTCVGAPASSPSGPTIACLAPHSSKPPLTYEVSRGFERSALSHVGQGRLRPIRSVRLPEIRLTPRSLLFPHARQEWSSKEKAQLAPPRDAWSYYVRSACDCPASPCVRGTQMRKLQHRGGPMSPSVMPSLPVGPGLMG